MLSTFITATITACLAFCTPTPLYWINLHDNYLPEIQAEEVQHTPQPEPQAQSQQPTPQPAPEPQPSPEPAHYRGMGNGTSDVEQWRSQVANHFGDLGQGAIETALCLIRAESGGNPHAWNQQGSSATGLMQVMAGTWGPRFGFTRAELEIPENNLWVSRQLYNDGGWGHWSPYKRGSCR